MNRRLFFKIISTGIACPALILMGLKTGKIKRKRLVNLKHKSLKYTRDKKPVHMSKWAMYDGFTQQWIDLEWVITEDGRPVLGKKL